MPSTTRLSAQLLALIEEQDGVVTTNQLQADGFSSDAVYRKCRSKQWQWMLPGVVLTVSGTSTRRQRLIGAHLWAGVDSLVDGVDACDWYGVGPAWMNRDTVHVVTPWGSRARSRDFVVVRRSLAEVIVSSRGRVPYVDPATALVVGARGARFERQATALLSRGLQQGIVDLGQLRDARDRIGHKWCGAVDAALRAVGVGLRSPAEKDARDLILTSRILPEPLWNQWLDLGDGGSPVCVDALWKDASMVHEVNGKRYHAWAEQFVDMHARNKRLTAAGLVAIGSAPVEIRTQRPATLDGIERTYARNAGRGMPAGITLIDPASIATWTR
jgi:hypothetical protein